MALALVVLNAFGDYRKGDKITDAETVATIQASDDARHTVRAILPDVTPPTKGKASA